MAKRTPVKISKENNLKIIIILLIIVISLIAITHFHTIPRQQTVKTTVSSEIHTKEKPKQQSNDKKNPEINFSSSNYHTSAITALEVPYYDRKQAQFVIRNKTGRYTLMYDTCYRQAAWVAYLLTRKEVRTKGTKRKNNFRSDPEVVAKGWATATTKDYVNSGYDRGHLLPSADRDDTPAENSSTFYLSNISPQSASLNRGVWKNLEERIREWADSYDSLYIVTGGELKPDLKRINNGIGVPERFFKAILTEYNGKYYAIAFLIPNDIEGNRDFGRFSLSVNALEDTLKYDFFPNLPNNIEEKIEENVNMKFWR